jgi:Ca2+-binding EF-hand superfamily protein
MGRRRGSSATDAAAVPRAPPPTAEVMSQLASSTHFSAPELLSLSQRFAELDSDGDGLVEADEVCAMGEVAMYPLLRRVVSRFNEDKSGALNFGEFCRALSTLSAKAPLLPHLHASTPIPPLRPHHLHARTASTPTPPHLHAHSTSPRLHWGVRDTGSPDASQECDHLVMPNRSPAPIPTGQLQLAFYYHHAHYLLLTMVTLKATLEEKLECAFALYDVNGNGRISSDEMFDVFRLMSPRHYTDDALQQIVSAFMAEYPQGLEFEDFSQMFALSDLAKLTLNL